MATVPLLWAPRGKATDCHFIEAPVERAALPRCASCIDLNSPPTTPTSSSPSLPTTAHSIYSDTQTMVYVRSVLQNVCSALLLLAMGTEGLKFDIQAGSGHDSLSRRCIRNFVAKDMLVVVTAIVDGYKGDGMQLNMHIMDAAGNEYGKPKDIAGEQRTVFTSHADAAFDVCFENILTGNKYVQNPNRHVELDIDIGADAKDWAAVQASEKLKPVETELRRIEEMVGEIVSEMDYLRHREQKLRDTNESTNNRVKWFGFLTTFLLVGLWAWQIMYLRAYFRSKHLI
ncbi:vesicle coat component [Podospora pseudopauciseta]|uniref:Vesicle coat component n=1 Tax=Podospora pseudopauciseta TaxID=2093780 RepID=A0ABR0HN73_9PEZI|nr:vesicle coat component [Podospora pseudopauciseta]